VRWAREMAKRVGAGRSTLSIILAGRANGPCTAVLAEHGDLAGCRPLRIKPFYTNAVEGMQASAAEQSAIDKKC